MWGHHTTGPFDLLRSSCAVPSRHYLCCALTWHQTVWITRSLRGQQQGLQQGIKGALLCRGGARQVGRGASRSLGTRAGGCEGGEPTFLGGCGWVLLRLCCDASLCAEGWWMSWSIKGTKSSVSLQRGKHQSVRHDFQKAHRPQSCC